MPKMRVLTVLILLAMGVTAYGGETIENPIEIGDVRWGRDFDAALENSAKTGKPILVLFQEIPGCSGVQKFGREVLTNPLLVEAIENEFIPMLVYNNSKGGMDQKLLKRFQEPAWNYQVIRFLNAAGYDVIPRKDRVWTTSGVASRRLEALMAANRPVPEYLKNLVNAEQSLSAVPKKTTPAEASLAYRLYLSVAHETKKQETMGRYSACFDHFSDHCLYYPFFSRFWRGNFGRAAGTSASQSSVSRGWVCECGTPNALQFI